MRTVTAAIGSLVFFVIAPGTLAGWGPWAIAGYALHAPFGGWAWTRVAGAAIGAAGAALLIACFAEFVRRGRGTPAPVAPPSRLVVSGLYRFVRNPMYVGVLTVIAGQALVIGSAQVLAYGLVVACGFHAFVWLYE